MIDWKEFFPVQAVAPFIGGLLLWFGLNYVYLSPAIITPRLVQTYYIPACLASTSVMQGAYHGRLKGMDDEFEKKLGTLRQDMAERMNSAAGASLGMIFGNSPEGQRLARQGQALIGTSMAGNYLRMGIEQEMTKARTEYEAQKERFKAELRSKQKHSDMPGYCACTVGDGLANRVDTALYVASLRIYKPEVIARLEQGTPVSEACGAPPVGS